MCCTRQTWSFPSRGWPGSPSGCSRCRSRCTSCRSGSSSRTLSPAPARRHSAPGRRASSARWRGTPWPSPDGTLAPRRSTAPGIRSSRCTPCPDAPWLPPRPQGASPRRTRPIPVPFSRCASLCRLWWIRKDPQHPAVFRKYLLTFFPSRTSYLQRISSPTTIRWSLNLSSVRSSLTMTVTSLPVLVSFRVAFAVFASGPEISIFTTSPTIFISSATATPTARRSIRTVIAAATLIFSAFRIVFSSLIQIPDSLMNRPASLSCHPNGSPFPGRTIGRVDVTRPPGFLEVNLQRRVDVLRVLQGRKELGVQGARFEIGDLDGGPHPVVAARVVEIVVLVPDLGERLARIGRDRRQVELLDQVRLVDVAARPEFARPHVVRRRSKGDPVLAAVVVLEPQLRPVPVEVVPGPEVC